MAFEESSVWAAEHDTSVEIVDAIFARAGNDEQLAQRIWAERPRDVLDAAFAESTAASLIWDGRVIQRPNG
ncbi:YccJ family protein [Nocardia stercoris]|uniref:Uncharacterized protein n=1 Tax=Nocardia stercoris TaxID=2483361 RepID=A0A3M2L7C5_9NOCA|nr:YccJ family protein [Nocardia stercoris]RMI33244.1 hypothetical protein EBN03_08620 [Nocardia stercoris]